MYFRTAVELSFYRLQKNEKQKFKKCILDQWLCLNSICEKLLLRKLYEKLAKKLEDFL